METSNCYANTQRKENKPTTAVADSTKISPVIRAREEFIELHNPFIFKELCDRIFYLKEEISPQAASEMAQSLDSPSNSQPAEDDDWPTIRLYHAYVTSLMDDAIASGVDGTLEAASAQSPIRNPKMTYEFNVFQLECPVSHSKTLPQKQHPSTLYAS